MNYTKLRKLSDSFWNARPEWDEQEIWEFKGIVQAGDIMVASWEIANLLFGPDDGTAERDDVECQMQKVMQLAFCGGKAWDEVLDNREAKARMAAEA